MTGVDTPEDFAILLPPGWVRLPLDGREHERVVALVNAKVQELPAQAREGVRRVMTRDLLEVLAQAGQAGAVDALFWLREVDDVPLAASGLVTFLDARTTLPLEALVTELVAEGASVSVVAVAGAPAVRRRTRQELEPSDHDPDLPALWTTIVDYFVPLPGSDGLLVLSFATPVEALSEAMVELFDAMAESVKWVSHG